MQYMTMQTSVLIMAKSMSTTEYILSRPSPIVLRGQEARRIGVSTLSTLRKTTNPHSSAKRQVKRRSKKAHIHISLRRSFGDKVDASATVEESGIKFNNMFTVDNQRHTKSTIPACHIAPCTEPTFLEPETFPPDEVRVPTLTETGKLSLDGWTTSPPEHVVETAYLARGRSNSGGMSPPAIPSALGYDHYRYSEEIPYDGGYATNHWDSRVSHMQHTLSQPSAITGGLSFAPRPLMYDAGGLSPGASEESGVQFRGRERYHLDAYSAIWPSGNIPRHKQIKTMDNETAQEARFGIVHSQTYLCGRNAHEQVGYLYKPETTSTSWGHTSADTYYPPPSAHIWREQRGSKGPVPSESTAGWDRHRYYAPDQDVGNTLMARGPDPRLAGYYNHDLPGAYMYGAATQPASMEGFDTISPHASGSVQSHWEATDTSAGPSYQGAFSTWY
ncbi:hypothetical protein C8Q78DRAFT_1142660 [Trametes maxima]|nr:hypothetical protein C8Q78DRAFT_1142660 [Trametes maxima]